MSLLKDKIEYEVEMAEFKAQQALGGFPKLLRWILVVSILGIIPGYFIAKGISYRYWEKQYKQYEISAKPSFTDPKDPKKSDVLMTAAGNGIYAAAVEITNENLDLVLPQIGYEFIFSNEKGEQVFRETGETYLLANEKKYVVAPRIESKDGMKYADFNFTTEFRWQKKVHINKISIEPNTPRTYNQFEPPAYVIEGNYYNNSPYELKQVRLVFLIYDNAKKIVGISKRDDFTVQPYERRSYKQIWPNVYADSGYTVKVFAETNPLDETNFRIPQQQDSNPASDLDRPKTEQY